MGGSSVELTTTADIKLLDQLNGTATATATTGEAGLAIQHGWSQSLPLAWPDGRATAAAMEQRPAERGRGGQEQD
jgi:hypothetical protein